MLLRSFPKGCKYTTISRRVKSHTGLKILRPRRKLKFHNSLPFDVMSLIFNNLDESSTKNLSCVSRFFNSSLEHQINKFKEEHQEEKIKKIIEYYNNYQNNYYYEPYSTRLPPRFRFYNDDYYTKKSKKKYSKNIQKDFNMIKNIRLKRLKN
mgnify:CR=1 FL=1